jgi:GNAT superfamily N-acetyltransferase
MVAGFTLGVATADDAAAVGALLVESYGALLRPSYEPDVLDLALPLMTRANPRLLASGRYYLASTADGALAGCGGWSAEQPGSGAVVAGEAHVRHFAVHPGFVRQGVGRALVARCRNAAIAEGFARFTCYSRLMAAPFYRAVGFVEVGPMQIELAPGVAIAGVRMAMDLT